MQSLKREKGKIVFGLWLVSWAGLGAAVPIILTPIQVCCDHALYLKWGIYIYPACIFYLETDGREDDKRIFLKAFLESVVANAVAYVIAGCLVWTVIYIAKRVYRKL
jgi:hypothetical protein